jgi:hypothetical protein
LVNSLSLGRKGGQASSKDLLPLGYGERERARVRVSLTSYLKTSNLYVSDLTKEVAR